MARTSLGSISETADEVLKEIEADAFIKSAERQIVQETAKNPQSQLGQLMAKLAADIRDPKNDSVTYTDLDKFMRSASHGR